MFRSGTELVLVNVVVRDKSGAVVRNLSRDDFTVTEDDKPQTITSFDFEELVPSPTATDRAAAPSPAAADRSPAATPAQSILSSPGRADDRSASAERPSAKVDMRGRRLIVLFFDLSSMQPEELERAVTAAHDYVEHKLADADLIAIASFSTSLQVVQDFTADAETLRNAIDGFGSDKAARASTTAWPATSKTRRTPATRSPPTTPSSTSSIPIAVSTHCRRWPTSSPASSRRSRSFTSAAA